MPGAIQDREFHEILRNAKTRRTKSVPVGDETREISVPFRSPEDWRDQFIYFLMVDRFNNPRQPPNQPYDAPVGTFQGGTFEGIRQQLGYLQELGVSALWLTPVLQNCQHEPGSYHGYGIQHFLKIDPRFASNRNDPEGELQALIDEAHARGLYVIFDIVLNHAGNVFAYVDNGEVKDLVPYRESPYPIRWRDESGRPNPAWEEAPQPSRSADLSPEAAVWPTELRKNDYFWRRGSDIDRGDFFTLRKFDNTRADVRRDLILAYEYLIAKFDIDGFRIDTLKYIGVDFERLFGNAIREYALSIGKKNFFTFGEIFDEEEKIAHFIGRRVTDQGDLVGVDAALDFPLFFRLPDVAKGLQPVSSLSDLYQRRKDIQAQVISSHGEASRYFVTFLDNHDGLDGFKSRFYYCGDPADPDRFNDQVALAVACLCCLQGIPCLYYGTEQGLSGHGTSDQALREALWGLPDGGFNPTHPFYQAIKALTDVRARHPALRYGRQYFRPISWDRTNYEIPRLLGGVLAVSRILGDTEVVLVANTHSANPATVWVIVDASLNPTGTRLRTLFSNKPQPTPVGAVEQASQVHVVEPNGSTGRGPLQIIQVTLQPMEARIIGRH
jgi:glycosidase